VDAFADLYDGIISDTGGLWRPYRYHRPCRYYGGSQHYHCGCGNYGLGNYYRSGGYHCQCRNYGGSF